MQQTRLQYLVARYASKELSASEWNELEAILNERGNDSLVTELMAIIEYSPDNRLATNEQLKTIAEAIVSIDRPPVIIKYRRRYLRRAAWLRYAAAILIVVAGVAFYYFFSSSSRSTANTTASHEVVIKSDLPPGYSRAVLTLSDGTKTELNSAASETIQDGSLSIVNNSGRLSYKNAKTAVMNTMTTPRGGQYQLTLSDGTQVWLNAGSSITFPTAFTGQDRQVSVTGEVYFEVAANKSHPFIVRTPKDVITVLGTSFNVNVYEDEPHHKTTLVEGSVRIGDLVLKPGYAYINGSAHQTNIQQDIAWKNGMFNFHKVPLESALRQLARWYDLTVVFKTKPNMILGGTMGRDLTLREALKIFSEMGVKYELKEKVLEIQ